MPRTPSPDRPLLRAAIIAGVVLVAVGIDAATGLNLMVAASCTGFFVLQFLAMTVGIVLLVAGLVIWIFSGFQSREALFIVAGALTLDVAALLLNYAAAFIGIGCIN
jgi:hypothetical protein